MMLMTNLHQKPRWLLITVTGTLLWLFLLYGRSLYQITPEELRLFWRALGPLTMTLDFLNPIFHSAWIFGVSYLLGLASLAWMTTKLINGWIWRFALTMGGLAALVFPLIIPLTYGEYQMPVRAVEGYALQWITRPANRYSSAFKQAQLIHQGECDYHLSGWSQQNTLYYTSDCLPGTWRYSPGAEQSSWSLFPTGRMSLGVASITSWNGGLYLPQPTSLTESQGYPFITLERAPSSDAQWEAVVVRWFYGPSDIIVVSRANP